MLKPAILYADQIKNELAKIYYTDDMFNLTGDLTNWKPDIDSDRYGACNYAIVDKNDKLLGYLSYTISATVSLVSQFGVISFDKGNPIVGKDLFEKLEELVSNYHIVEWKMVSGNPVERAYDKFCKKHNGSKHIFRDRLKDSHGKLHDDILYEIIS